MNRHPEPEPPSPAAEPDDPHPPYEPYHPHQAGHLDVGDGQRVHWAVAGNPDGHPALVVHGGPGSGSSTGALRRFDPDRYRVVLLDQRGCGRSTPHASDPATDLRHNTTDHLVADMEAVRAHLGIDRWLLYGGSWGSTLLLAYAQRFPSRVSAIVVHSVTTTRRSEIDWLYRGVGRFLPEAWERFVAASGTAPGAGGISDVLRGYAELTSDPDQAVRDRATAAWCAWEDAVLSLELAEAPAVAHFAGRPDAARRATVRICAHYFAAGAWLEEGALLRDAPLLTGIPGVLIHGRHDMGGPPRTAWELARRWPDARLTIVEDAGHLGNARSGGLVTAALDRFADMADR
ncbi:prolyl aminopeptidase [Streptomyces bohaiensis]|uniref:Proline iminopeptidase n=2 Tax=Streptomyces bohaiensis TaxID=1431344 RepID=A0ABX1C848_9ACTN|nr:prolyl aminopeptidase [Streptomyces bohaiensis]NJQ15331.1 prolyl aminopeptidase [Streptomyces bohaiensis]